MYLGRHDLFQSDAQFRNQIRPQKCTNELALTVLDLWMLTTLNWRGQ